MTAVDLFVWVVTLASLVAVIIWGIVACMVLHGAFLLCRDAWRALRSKA